MQKVLVLGRNPRPENGDICSVPHNFEENLNKYKHMCAWRLED